MAMFINVLETLVKRYEYLEGGRFKLNGFTAYENRDLKTLDILIEYNVWTSKKTYRFICSVAMRDMHRMSPGQLARETFNNIKKAIEDTFLSEWEWVGIEPTLSWQSENVPFQGLEINMLLTEELSESIKRDKTIKEKQRQDKVKVCEKEDDKKDSLDNFVSKIERVMDKW